MAGQTSPKYPRDSFSVTGRRQNRSCDQCRKGKRACDASPLDIAKTGRRDETSSLPSPGQIISTTEERDKFPPQFAKPCSNCEKTGKECTFTWLRPSKQRSSETVPEGQKQPTNPRSINRHLATNVTREHQEPQEPKVPEPDLLYSPLDQNLLQDGFEFLDNPNILQLDNMGPMQLSPLTTERSNQFLPIDLPYRWPDNSPSVFTCPSLQSEDSLVQDYFPLDYDIGQYSHATQASQTFDNNSTRDGEEDLRPGKRRRRSNFGRTTTRSGSRSSFGSNRQRPDNGSSRRWSIISDPSSDSLPQRLASSACTSHISGGLMRIYHDSMENALSCWLNETTCPYSIGSSSRHQGQTLLESMTDEWGPNWSNRICSRVCRLDRAASTARDRPLTKIENQAASRALQTVIMAFATQWAQSSQRSTREYSSFTDLETEADGSQVNEFPFSDSPFPHNPGTSLPAPTEFDRMMQETFWHQARQALHETAGIQSFRVIFAHIIFSMTQRPLNLTYAEDTDADLISVDEQELQMKARRHRSSVLDDFDNYRFPDHYDPATTKPFAALKQNSISDELDEIIQSEGPPLFFELALRQIHSYRCKLDAWERENAILLRDTRGTRKKGDLLTAEDRKTFDMLFWLGVMIDTLSSVMNKRPLVVSDEDSDIIPESTLDPPSTSQINECEEGFGNDLTFETPLPSRGYGSKLWGQFFFQQKRTQHSEDIVRWPCTYEKAAATLSYAAPIKVLLFRKVSHLQTLLSRRARQEKFEEAIIAALRVYQHWNNEYGPFMLDCIANHDALPPRIQSWYIILAGHWHLGAMLLADVIELVDKAKMSFVSRRLQRRSSHLVTRLRVQNAYAVSDLGKCSCPRSDASFPNFREFHFAVNKGALLTEPWTVVLIRSFAKAGILLLDMMAQGDQESSVHAEREQIIARCEYCIEALWHLGKKSDMAYLAATALSTAFKDERRRLPNLTSDMSSGTGIQDWELDIEEQLNLGFDDPFSFNFSEVPYQSFMTPAVSTA
ncbi:uncharacterized protein PAC_02603 [Phialocephala subalpina]|uniref:Zn(2)-C6 fungal-type domain-containing protein n=1 Tax=Phialocephala subalpina TaxID=576137 RepID=A0A1L7WIY1_9HELO|nr:uncharacterized protein PAC_02603 [Phialocephala subalpina]